MPIFKKKVGRGLAPADIPVAVTPADDGAVKLELEQEQEIAAIIAAISAISAGVRPSKIIVRNIVRVSEQATNWNRLTLE